MMKIFCGYVGGAFVLTYDPKPSTPRRSPAKALSVMDGKGVRGIA